ncbi:MAG: class I adenylate-forming enzyme family protein [Ilumatobacteraceae bacterium]
MAPESTSAAVELRGRLGQRWRQLTARGALYEMQADSETGLRHWVNGPQTLREVLDSSARFGGRPFLQLADEILTFDEHRRSVAALAAHLRDLGVRRGDRVAIAMRNRPEFSVSLFAVVALGAVAMPCNAWWTDEDTTYVIQAVAPAAAIVDSERAKSVGEAIERSGRPVVRYPTASSSPFDWHEAKTSEEPLPDDTIEPDDIATIFFTSGTSGRPKGVVGTHRNITSAALARTFFRDLDRDGEPIGLVPVQPGRSLLTVPLFHVTGTHAYLLGAITSGSLLVLMHKWDAHTALALINDHSIGALGGVPHVAAQLLDAIEQSGATLESLRSISVGGAPCPPSLIDRATKLLPQVQFANGYGMTETSSVAIYSFGQETSAHPEAIGRVNPIMDAIAVDSSGQRLRIGNGELWMRGANVAAGYWDGEGRPLLPLGPDGWLVTGDIVTIHADGLIEIAGRVKDTIIRGGENIQPAEIESIALAHPAVEEAAAFGAPHTTLGEVVHLAVRRKPGVRSGLDDLPPFLRDRLARIKVPAVIWEHAEPLPRNPQGKLIRSAVADERGRRRL